MRGFFTNSYTSPSVCAPAAHTSPTKSTSYYSSALPPPLTPLHKPASGLRRPQLPVSATHGRTDRLLRVHAVPNAVASRRRRRRRRYGKKRPDAIPGRNAHPLSGGAKPFPRRGELLAVRMRGFPRGKHAFRFGARGRRGDDLALGVYSGISRTQPPKAQHRQRVRRGNGVRERVQPSEVLDGLGDGGNGRG